MFLEERTRAAELQRNKFTPHPKKNSNQNSFSARPLADHRRQRRRDQARQRQYGSHALHLLRCLLCVQAQRHAGRAAGAAPDPRGAQGARALPGAVGGWVGFGGRWFSRCLFYLFSFPGLVLYNNNSFFCLLNLSNPLLNLLLNPSLNPPAPQYRH